MQHVHAPAFRGRFPPARGMTRCHIAELHESGMMFSFEVNYTDSIWQGPKA